jgi:hypothetical protein
MKRAPLPTALAAFLLTIVVGLMTPSAAAQSDSIPASTLDAGVDVDAGVDAEVDGVETSARRIEAVRLSGDLTVDGLMDEPAWENAVMLSDFVQRDPVEGAQPTERTEVYVAYDEEAVYIGARLYDTAPDSIVARLGRRDAQLKADAFMVFLDPYNDGRSGYYFGVNAAGTLYDGVLLNDDWSDSDWDGVWQGRASIDSEGWTAELRIPYSQIRFYQQDQYVWGINFKREIARKNEVDYIVYTPRQESGFVSRFWDLSGVSGITPSRQIELTPYVTSKAEFTDQPSGNPFNDGSDYGFDLGADVKMGLTSNLTLNATVNPDFGQVEVDPAVINLSDNETFFPEKRPFFIEGASTFTNFGYGGSNDNWGFNWGNPDFFYSRRIGRAPQGSLPDHEFSDVPDGAKILGAAKLTGQVFGDLNVGTVHAITAQEHADLYDAGRDFRVEVEPATYYGVYRGQKEFNDSRQGLGFIGTVTNRFIDDDRLADQMNSRALVLGGDGWTFLDRDKTWVINGWSGVSHVRANETQMLSLQQSFMHYFQRPDAGHVEVDSSATTMTGWAGRVALNKQRGRVMLNTAVGTISPSFNINDLGFIWRTDVINGHFGFGYRWPDPTRFTRSGNLIGAVFQSLDYDGNSIWRGVWTRAYAQLLNYYDAQVFFAYNPQTVNNRRTRGGPLTLNQPGWEIGAFLSSDSRKPLTVGLRSFSYRTENSTNGNVGVDFEWKPATNASVTLSPSVGWNYEDAQWVEAYDDPLATATFGRRYVFANLDQLTVSSSVRLNWTFTPEMSFQLYAQPLISSGDYYGYKELVRPRSYDFMTYGEGGGSTFDEASLTADPDGAGPAPALELPNLDFNFTSLRGTAVMRWEYMPGSILYLVWTQQMSDSIEDGRFRLGPSIDQLRAAPMDNIFMIKLTYWLSR